VTGYLFELNWGKTKMRPIRKQSYPDDFQSSDEFGRNDGKREDLLLRDSYSDLFDSKNLQPTDRLE
jgi:hypothetical protein